jgi:hypothetical protein
MAMTDPSNLSDLALNSDQRERAIEMTPTAGPSSLSDLALNSDQRERAIEMTLTAGPSRRLRFMRVGLLTFLAMVVAINWLTDPYGVWRIALIDRVYLSTQPGERVLTPYRVRNEQPTTMLIGNSRVLWGMPIEQAYRAGVFNASLPGASLDELAAIVDVALSNPRLKRLVWGVDFAYFDTNWSARDPLMRLRLEGNLGLKMTDTLFSTQALTASRKLLMRAVGGRKRLSPTQSVAVPWPQAVIAQALDDSLHRGVTTSKWRPAEWVPTYTRFRLSSQNVALFHDTVARARRAGIDVIVFIGPTSPYELEVIRQSGRWDTFQEWKRQLLSTQPYWDFSGYNELAFAEHLFTDAVHYEPGVGHLILRHLLGEDTTHCGETAPLILDSGAWVDAATVDQHLAQQDAARVARTAVSSRYQTLVTEMLRQ